MGRVGARHGTPLPGRTGQSDRGIFAWAKQGRRAKGRQERHMTPREGMLGDGSPGYTETDKKEDMKTLHSMGYAQELERRLSRFSNFAVSFSIICILSGGIN